MKKRIGLGRDVFKNLIEEKCYYIDKTKFIEEIFKEIGKTILFTRPRISGKTLNLTMLKSFFDIKKSDENRKLFKNLYIENSPIMKELSYNERARKISSYFFINVFRRF